MEVTITIKAPELAAAIQSLADAIVATGCIPVEIPKAVKEDNTPTEELVQQVELETPPKTAVPVAPTAAVPATQAVPGVPPAAVPVAPPTYTVEELGIAASPLMDAGRGPELIALLAQYGVQALTQLAPDHYGSFATQLRQLGARI